MKARLQVIVAAAILLINLTIAPRPVLADNAFQCNGGSNVAIVNACGARWEAANVRAHIVTQTNGGYSTSCLTKTSDLLEQLATKWLTANSYKEFTGTWPCGKIPDVASADDGALAHVCPGTIWSYENKGKVECSIDLNAAPAPAFVAPAAPPMNLTGRWYGRGTPDGIYNIVQDGMTITWSAHSVDGVTWGNDFKGLLNGNVIVGIYRDEPGYPANNVGNLALRVADACHIYLDSTNISDYATSVWTKDGC